MTKIHASALIACLCVPVVLSAQEVPPVVYRAHVSTNWVDSCSETYQETDTQLDLVLTFYHAAATLEVTGRRTTDTMDLVDDNDSHNENEITCTWSGTIMQGDTTTVTLEPQIGEETWRTECSTSESFDPAPQWILTCSSAPTDSTEVLECTMSAEEAPRFLSQFEETTLMFGQDDAVMTGTLTIDGASWTATP